MFVWIDSLRSINNLSVMKGRIFLGWTSTKLGHNAVMPVRLEHTDPRSRVKYSTTEPLRSLCLLCLCGCLLICPLWSPAGKGLTSWPSFVVSYYEFVTFPLVSWVRCGTWLYRFLIFPPLHTCIFTAVKIQDLIFSLERYCKIGTSFFYFLNMV